MRSGIFILNGLRKIIDQEQYSNRFKELGFSVRFDNVIPNLMEIPSYSVLVVEGKFFPDAVSSVVETGRRDLSLIGINPLWNHNIRNILHQVEIPVMILTDSSDLSDRGISAMKYHDRIAGSIVRYLRGDETRLKRPERMIQLIQEWLNESKQVEHTNSD